MIERCTACFREQHAILWQALSRTINLLAVLNVSLFFLNGAVRTGGYWFPVVSLMLLALAALLTLLPLGMHHLLAYYLFVTSLCVGAGWLLGASILHWIRAGTPC